MVWVSVLSHVKRHTRLNRSSSFSSLFQVRHQGKFPPFFAATSGNKALVPADARRKEDARNPLISMLYGKPVYMYRFPNMTAPDGSIRTFDNNPAVMVPHEFNMGYNGMLLDEEPIEYPPG